MTPQERAGVIRRALDEELDGQSLAHRAHVVAILLIELSAMERHLRTQIAVEQLRCQPKVIVDV